MHSYNHVIISQLITYLAKVFGCGVCECYCNEHRNWINNNTSVIVKHHLLDFISPREHFLRDIFTSHNNRTYIEEHPQRVHLSQEYIYYYSHNNGSSQKACSPGYISPGESTHNRAVTHMSIRRPVLRRLANRRKGPTPDYPKPDYQPPTIRSRTIHLRHRGSR